MSSAPRGLAPREGLELVLMKMGCAGPPFEPRRRTQVGKSGDPRSQNTDSSPRAHGAPGLSRAERQKGKCEASWALTACGLGHRVAVDWTWAPLQPRELIRSGICPLPPLLSPVAAQIPFLAPLLPASEIFRPTPSACPSQTWRLAKPRSELGTRPPWTRRTCRRRALLGCARWR